MLPINVFVIEHPLGVCLFDAGQSAHAAVPGYLPRWHPFLRLARFELTSDDEVAAQLARVGISPRDLRWIVLSHLHTDHVGGLEALSRAASGVSQVLISRAEWFRARGLAGKVRGYVPQHWPPGIVPSLVDFDGPAIGPFAGSHDVAGDGMLTLVPTPGHTPGHLAMLLHNGNSNSNSNSKPFLLAGDMAHDAAGIADVAPSVANYCRREGIAVLTAHDPRAAAITEEEDR